MSLPSEYDEVFKNMARFLLNKKIKNAEAAVEVLQGSAVLWIQQIDETDNFNCAILENDEQRILLLQRLYATYGPTLAPPYTEAEIINSGISLPPLLRAYLIKISREISYPNGIKHLIELKPGKTKIGQNGPYINHCTRRASADGRSLWDALYRPFDHFNRNINKDTVKEWLIARKRGLSPEHVATELPTYLPPDLRWYLENVSRELYFDSYPILFKPDNKLSNCTIPADQNSVEYDDDDLLNGMVQIGEGGCAFTTHIVVDRNSSHYGTIWSCNDDWITLEYMCFMDYIHAAMRYP